jgi:hypothetical protein
MNSTEKPKLQAGIFSFLYQRGCKMCEMRRILSLYALEKGIKRPKKGKDEWYVGISNLASENFKEFKKSYNKNKDSNITPPKTYDEWWNECNLDGTFAYNGCTDDF